MQKGRIQHGVSMLYPPVTIYFTVSIIEIASFVPLIRSLIIMNSSVLCIFCIPQERLMALIFEHKSLFLTKTTSNILNLLYESMKLFT